MRIQSVCVVVFVSSYFDFVRVRNLLTKEEVSFAVNSEYTEPREAARARTLFADGRKRVLLLSERAHFYFRRRIKGAREICFYSLPEHAHYYPELVSYLAGSASTASGSAPVVGHAPASSRSSQIGRAQARAHRGERAVRQDDRQKRASHVLIRLAVHARNHRD